MLALNVNIDKIKSVSENLQIRTLPTSFIIYNGQIIDQVSGMPNKDEFNEFFKTADILYESDKKSFEFEDLINASRKKMLEGKVKDGIEELKNLLINKDFYEKYKVIVLLSLANGYLDLKNVNVKNKT